MEKYIVFAKSTCPFCVKAIELLNEKQLDSKVINFDDTEDQKLLESMKDTFDHRTVPMVFAREGNQIEFIGGYTDLAEHLSTGE